MTDFPECHNQSCKAEDQVPAPEPDELCPESRHFAILFTGSHPTYHELTHMYLSLRQKINLIEETITEIGYRWARVVMSSEESREACESASQRMIGVREALDAVREIKGDTHE